MREHSLDEEVIRKIILENYPGYVHREGLYRYPTYVRTPYIRQNIPDMYARISYISQNILHTSEYSARTGDNNRYLQKNWIRQFKKNQSKV
jgi:hypothetical protein